MSALLRTMSLTLNCLGRTRLLWYPAAFYFWASETIEARSLLSSSKSRQIRVLRLLTSRSTSPDTRQLNELIFIEITASIPYVSLKGVSPVDVIGIVL